MNGLPTPPHVRLRRITHLSRLLDGAFRIPGTNIRFGLDSLVGLAPGVGDGLTALVSVYIIREAAKLGAPRGLQARMLGNIAIDLLVGSVPVLGDIFDVTWKANQRNVRLLQRHLDLGKTVKSPAPER